MIFSHMDVWSRMSSASAWNMMQMNWSRWSIAPKACSNSTGPIMISNLTLDCTWWKIIGCLQRWCTAMPALRPKRAQAITWNILPIIPTKWTRSWKKNRRFSTICTERWRMRSSVSIFSLNTIFIPMPSPEQRHWSDGCIQKKGWFHQEILFQCLRITVLSPIWITTCGKKPANCCAAGLTKVLIRCRFPSTYPEWIFIIPG